MNPQLLTQLSQFREQHNVKHKGNLSVVLHVSRLARTEGLPLNALSLQTSHQGQVRGLGRATIQSILAEYGIQRVLAQEGGRTSRGSMGMMQDYVHFLNQLHADQLDDLPAIERWWVDRIIDYFNSQPFTLRYDVSRSLRAMIRNLLAQARQRQEENPGTTYIGTMLQHLVGAKLELVLQGRNIPIEHHGASVADAVFARDGDFVIDNVSIHVSTAPSHALMQKCQQNLTAGCRPIIVTVHDMVATAEGNARIENLEDRIDILAADQFLAANLHELSGFQDAKRPDTIHDLIAQYNRIVAAHESDPSLRIQIGG
jgi:hypothetical protein